jgi:hypothetical protein
MSDASLRVYIVWMPILKSDDRLSAQNRSAEFADERLAYFWDAHEFTGKLWREVLGVADIPWDVYLLYNANAQWNTAPEAPDFWTRQIGGAMKGRFELKLKELLNQVH